MDLSIIDNDLITYGSAAFFLLVVFLLLNGDDKSANYTKRLERVKSTHSGKSVSKTNLQLRRQEKKSSLTMVTWLFHKFSFINKLNTRLNMAGLDVTTEKYLTINVGIVLFVLLILWGLLAKPIALSALVGLVLGLGLPHFFVGFRINKRKKAFLSLFPDAIDLIVRGLRAGLPVTQSLQTVSEEIPDPLGPVFKEIGEQVILGMNLEDAMATMARRVGITEFNFFVTSIILQRETGGNLGEILSNLSDVLRQRHMMKMKIKAMSSEAKASAMIVGALPFFVFGAISFTSPDYLAPLYDDFRGNLAAFGALCSISLGGFVMAKMASFDF